MTPWRYLNNLLTPKSPPTPVPHNLCPLPNVSFYERCYDVASKGTLERGGGPVTSDLAQKYVTSHDVAYHFLDLAGLPSGHFSDLAFLKKMVL